ncbi:MAG: amino acid permease [Chlorobiales bacterium]|nr:amino acid permease [Chlorobiales bacterium]
MKDKLFFKKSLHELINSIDPEHQGLKRQLGPTNLVLLGIGAIIGAGLFSLTGLAAANNAGPAVTLSFILGAVGCAFAGLCYAEFASMIPVAGSAYTYAYATMGQLMAWIIGWDLVLEYAVGAATVAISWSQYLTKFLAYYHLYLPPMLTRSPWETITLADGSVVSGLFNLPAVFIVVATSLLLIKGTKESATFNALIVGLKVTVVIGFIILGWQHINPANHVPYIPENTGDFGHFGISGIFRGAAVVFFAYIGFDAVSTAAQEAKNPQRDMPIGILGSLFICAILYALFSHVMTGLANYTEFKDSAAPVAIAIAKTPYIWFSQLIILAILAGYSSVILVLLMGQSRVFFSMSNDRLLPKVFSDVHPTYRTPWKSNLLFMVFVSLFAALVPVHVVGEMTSIGTLLAFVLVCIGVIVMRKTHPDAPRAFKTPLVPLVPILGIIICFAMMAALPLDTWIRLIVWLVIGFFVYFGYSIKHANYLVKESATKKPTT